MFEGPISNNKEKINIAPSPPGTPLGKTVLLNSLNNTEILLFMFESSISNNKVNIKF